MRIFTKNERDYLIKLICRNMNLSETNEEVNKRNGLDKPMDNKERVRRTRIIQKSMDGIHDLVLAELSGIIPSKKDIKINRPSLVEMVEGHKKDLIFIIALDKKEESKWILSEYNYKVFSKLIEPNDSDENDDV